MRLIILDLNGVLVKHQGKGRASYRPGCTDLIKYLLNKIDTSVAIWTTLTSPNCQKIIDGFLDKETQSKLKFIWTSEQSTDIGNFKAIKNLDLVFDNFTQFNKSNTYIVDDDYEKVPYHQDNLIVISKYEGPRKCPTDTVLSSLMNKLDNLIHPR